jgi:hypothetical protein
MGLDVQSINHYVHFTVYILACYDVSKPMKPLTIRKSLIYVHSSMTNCLSLEDPALSATACREILRSVVDPCMALFL